MSDLCEECRHWRVNKTDDEVGFCRRYPPDHRGWPTTRFDDGCGEFDARRCASAADLLRRGAGWISSGERVRS